MKRKVRVRCIGMRVAEISLRARPYSAMEMLLTVVPCATKCIAVQFISTNNYLVLTAQQALI